MCSSDLLNPKLRALCPSRALRDTLQKISIPLAGNLHTPQKNQPKSIKISAPPAGVFACLPWQVPLHPHHPNPRPIIALSSTNHSKNQHPASGQPSHILKKISLNPSKSAPRQPGSAFPLNPPRYSGSAFLPPTQPRISYLCALYYGNFKDI